MAEKEPGLRAKRVAVFLAVVLVASLLASYPHELGHKIAANALGHDGMIMFEGVMPTAFVMTIHLKDTPPTQAFIIGAAGGLAVVLVIVGFLFIVKNPAAKAALKIMVIMSLVNAVVEGVSATWGCADYTVLFFIWVAYALAVLEWAGITNVRKVFG